MNDELERRKKMKKSTVRLMLMITIMMISSLGIVGCNKSETLTKMDTFIRVLINNETYLNVKEEEVKELFLNDMTEEAYESYKLNGFLYAYPTIYAELNVDEVEISSIKCTKKENENYEFKVKYKLKTTKKKVEMTDYISITRGEDDKYTQVILMNTSDIIQKFYFDKQVK